MKSNSKANYPIIYRILFVLVLIGMKICACLYYKINTSDIIKNAVVTLFFGILIIFSYLRDTRECKKFKTGFRFLIFLLLCLGSFAVSCFFPLLSSTAWIIPVFWTCLALFSDSVTGLVAGSFLTLNAVMLSDVSFKIFALYFVTGFFAVLLFAKLDELYKIAIPIITTLSVLTVALVAQVVFFITGITKAESFLIPIINIFINLILYFVLLKIYSHTTIHEYREKYQTINDQEYRLMVRFKNQEEKQYKVALHTAYFAERLGGIFQMDTFLLKGGSYYNDINLIEKDMPMEFPKPLRELIVEMNSEDIRSKEAAVILICKKIITSMNCKLAKAKKSNVNYTDVIEEVFSDTVFLATIKNANITLGEMNEMKNYFIKEKMYFDFLK